MSPEEYKILHAQAAADDYLFSHAEMELIKEEIALNTLEKGELRTLCFLMACHIIKLTAN